MTQADTPVRPDESDEVRALRHLAGIAGWAVTSTTGGTHATRSLHYADGTGGTGRAVDLADRRGPSTNSEWLLAINEQIVRLLPLSFITELIYGGPGGFCVKDGKRVDGRVTYSSVIDAHRNHIHLAVVLGFTYNGSQELPMADDPNLPNIVGPVELQVLFNANGECTGYFVFSHATGELHGFGPGATFHGRSEVTKLVAT
jgi:hypothetical protein